MGLSLWDEQESPSCFSLDRLSLCHRSLGILSSRVIPAVSLPAVCVFVCVFVRLALRALLLSVRQSANCCLTFCHASFSSKANTHIFSHDTVYSQLKGNSTSLCVSGCWTARLRLKFVIFLLFIQIQLTFFQFYQQSKTQRLVKEGKAASLHSGIRE